MRGSFVYKWPCVYRAVSMISPELVLLAQRNAGVVRTVLAPRVDNGQLRHVGLVGTESVYEAGDTGVRIRFDFLSRTALYGFTVTVPLQPEGLDLTELFDPASLPAGFFAGNLVQGVYRLRNGPTRRSATVALDYAGVWIVWFGVRTRLEIDRFEEEQLAPILAAAAARARLAPAGSV